MPLKCIVIITAGTCHVLCHGSLLGLRVSKEQTKNEEEKNTVESKKETYQISNKILTKRLRFLAVRSREKKKTKITCTDVGVPIIIMMIIMVLFDVCMRTCMHHGMYLTIFSNVFSVFKISISALVDTLTLCSRQEITKCNANQ